MMDADSGLLNGWYKNGKDDRGYFLFRADVPVGLVSITYTDDEIVGSVRVDDVSKSLRFDDLHLAMLMTQAAASGQLKQVVANDLLVSMAKESDEFYKSETDVQAELLSGWLLDGVEQFVTTDAFNSPRYECGIS